MDHIPVPHEPRHTINNEEHSWEQYKRRLFLAVGLVAFLIVLASFISSTLNILLLLFLCVLLAVGLRGISDALAMHTPLGENAALALTVVTIAGLLVGLGLFIGPQLIEQFSQLGDTLADALSQVEEMLRQYPWGQQLIAQVPSVTQLGQQVIGEGFSDTFARITGIVSSVLSFLSLLIIIIFITLLFAAEPQPYVDNFLRLVPIGKRSRVHNTLLNVSDTLKQWLLMRLVSMGIIGSLTFIGLSIIGIPLMFSLAVIAAAAAFIPTFGPIIALIPAVLVGFIQSPQTALYVAILYIAVQMVDNYVISPILQKSMLYLPPAYIIVAQLFFGVIAGTFGLVLAAPLAAALVVIVRMLYVEDVLGDEMPASDNKG